MPFHVHKKHIKVCERERETELDDKHKLTASKPHWQPSCLLPLWDFPAAPAIIHTLLYCRSVPHTAHCVLLRGRSAIVLLIHKVSFWISASVSSSAFAPGIRGSIHLPAVRSKFIWAESEEEGCEERIIERRERYYHQHTCWVTRLKLVSKRETPRRPAAPEFNLAPERCAMLKRSFAGT